MISESRAAAALGHPHIVPVFEADEADGILYAAMRYVTGGNMRSLLSRHGPLPLGYAWRIVAQIASALDAAHAHGVIHRDVRPANILLDGDDADGRAAGGHAYLSDFGMSQAFPPGQVIAADQAAGMLDYLAPEQIEGRAADGRTDQYSLACAGVRVPVRHAAVRPGPGPDPDVRADLRGPSGRERAARRNTRGGRLGAGHRAGEGPGRPVPELRPVRRGTAGRARLRPGEPADPPRSPAPHGNGPVSGPGRPRPGRALLRVKQRQRPGAEDEARRPRRDSHALTADRPTGAGSLEPAPADDPGAAGPSGHRRQTLHRRRSGRPRPEPSARRIRPGACWRPVPWSPWPPRSYPVSSCRGDRLPPTRPPPPPRRLPPRRHPSLSSPSAAASPSAPVTAPEQAAALKRAADLERRRPDGAAQRGHPGRRAAPTCPARSASSRPS